MNRGERRKAAATLGNPQSPQRAAKWADEAIDRLVKSRFADAKHFRLGPHDFGNLWLAVWLTTQTDDQRNALTSDPTLEAEVREAFRVAGYPEGSLAGIVFAYESQETVDRDYKGSWFYATR